jgi:hypothetical protein
MIHHLLCYQGLAVIDYGFALDASDMAHSRLSLNWDPTMTAEQLIKWHKNFDFKVNSGLIRKPIKS